MNKFYACLRCKQEISLGRVEFMSLVGQDSFELHHTCFCTDNRVFERTFVPDHVALKRLLGGLRPTLPYSAAPKPPLPLSPAQEKILNVFRWECAQLNSVRDFLLLCSRPELR